MKNERMGLEAKNLFVCRKGKLILNDVSFKVKPGTLTAIIGPNGAGKTTLMRALSGERPDSGSVLINEDEMYADPQYWLNQIGYVPVSNILHDELNLYQALLHIGQLRLPHLTTEEIKARVDSLLTKFDFPIQDNRRHKPIRVLSSGERKRANICSELLMDPPILMLDEPTSNLDPDAERNVMHLLADYAHQNGQTILVITHTLNTINVCDEVIFIENARLCAAGNREEILQTLEEKIPDPQPESSSFYRWAQIFEHYKTDDNKRKSCADLPSRTKVSGATQSRQTTSVPWSHQLRYLLSRYMRVRLGDRWSLLGTLLAGLSGILFFILPADTFIEPMDPTELVLALNQARQSVYVVALVVTLIGLITSYTEISKEYHIYKHERLKGLSPSAYFMSKWIWLTLGVGVLAPLILLCFIVLIYLQPLPDFPEPRIGEIVNRWEQIYRFQLVGLLTYPVSWFVALTLIFACITSVTLGLFISAITGDSGKGYLYLSFTVVFIVLFSGLIQNDKLERLIDTLSFLSTGRWAFEGFASSLSIYCWIDSWQFEEYNSTGHILSIWLALLSFVVASIMFAIVILRVDDPWHGRWKNLQSILTQNLTNTLLFLSVLAILVSYTSFLRQQSYDYHALNYWSRQDYGGTGAYEYANIYNVQQPTMLQLWNGKLNQSWCIDR